MIREIRKKMVLINNRRPFKKEVREYLRDLELTEWVFMNLHLSGSGLEKDHVQQILDGGWVLNASVEEHVMIDRLRELYRLIDRYLDMKTTLSLQVIDEMHRSLMGAGEAFQYRKNNPVLLEYGYNPVIPTEIPAAMEELSRMIQKDEPVSTPFLQAAQIHNRFLAIYPYKEGNEYLARAAMYYFLAEKGYPMAAITMTEQEYNNSVIMYLKKGESGILCHALMQAVYRRLELMIQITGYGDF